MIEDSPSICDEELEFVLSHTKEEICARLDSLPAGLRRHALKWASFCLRYSKSGKEIKEEKMNLNNEEWCGCPWDNTKKNPLKKIKDLSRPCLSPSHNPPGHMVYSPGVYEWTCPVCGHVTGFTVPFVGG